MCKMKNEAWKFQKFENATKRFEKLAVRNNQDKNINRQNQFYFYFDFSNFRSVGPVKQLIKLVSPNIE